MIYFSLGSNVNTSHLPAETKQAIIDVFSELDYKVLMKFESTTLKLSKNVKTGQWFPQQDVLAHPNIKLFITHAGYASTIETVYHGVPIIAIPVFGDQKMNAVYAETKGFGRILPWQDITKNSFAKMIEEVIGNPR